MPLLAALPAISGAVSAGGGLLSNIFGGLAKMRLQKKAWAREDNAVQRRAKDLEKAGLSKTLAAGQAAQSGPAIHAQSGIEQLAGIPSGLGAAGQQYVNLQQQKQQIAQTRAQTRLIEAQAQSAEVDTDLKRREASYLTTPYGSPSDPMSGTTQIKAMNTPLGNKFMYEDIARQFNNEILQSHRNMIQNDEYRSDYEKNVVEQKRAHPELSEGEIELRAAKASMTLDELSAARERINQQFMERIAESTGGWIPPIMVDTIMQLLKQFAPTGIIRYGRGSSRGTRGGLPNPGENIYWKKVPMSQIK